MPNNKAELLIVGGGLAGCEAALVAARLGIRVRLLEMKPTKKTPAHKSDYLAELVCSNSLRSNEPATGPGLLKAEMRLAGSVVVQAAEECRVPAGGALAVDRDKYAKTVTDRIKSHDLIEVVEEELKEVPDFPHAIIATGPLTTDELAQDIIRLTGSDALHFADATAPIVDSDSIDHTIVFEASRYDKGDGGYLNCPMNEDEYNQFIDALLASDKVEFKEFEETKYFEGCMPIEEMARRGRMTPAFGPMKPVGLTDPRTGKRPFAVVQLRQEDNFKNLYNLVGFQTQMTWPEQKRVFAMIPGLEQAQFHRLGTIHRNTFIKSPLLLDQTLQLKSRPGLRFAGQITGVEGYIESAATGYLAGLFAAAQIRGIALPIPPPETAHGCLVRHLTESDPDHFQPMNINFGLMPPMETRVPKKLRKAAYRDRALPAFTEWENQVSKLLS